MTNYSTGLTKTSSQMYKIQTDSLLYHRKQSEETKFCAFIVIHMI